MPQIDIGKVQLNTDGTGVGGNMNKVGMHQFTLARWKGNSYNRGLQEPTKTSYEVGTEALGGGFDGIGAVKDQMIDQGIALCVSTDVEPTCAYFQGPQRVASEHNQITGSDVWGIFDFHLVAMINLLTGRKLTGLSLSINEFAEDENGLESNQLKESHAIYVKIILNQIGQILEIIIRYKHVLGFGYE